MNERLMKKVVEVKIIKKKKRKEVRIYERDVETDKHLRKFEVTCNEIEINYTVHIITIIF